MEGRTLSQEKPFSELCVTERTMAEGRTDSHNNREPRLRCQLTLLFGGSCSEPSSELCGTRDTAEGATTSVSQKTMKVVYQKYFMRELNSQGCGL